MKQGMQQLLKPRNGFQFTASKKMGASVPQPKELNFVNNPNEQERNFPLKPPERNDIC